MAASRKLDKAIAQKLGWSVSVEPLSGTTTLWEPNFRQHTTWGLVGLDNAELADKAWDGVPHFSTSAEAALTLLAEMPDNYTPRLVRMGVAEQGYAWKCGIMRNDPPVYEMVQEEAETPALAICRAWLVWKELSSKPVTEE